jgi:ketosteroid isomerase-like protein
MTIQNTNIRSNIFICLSVLSVILTGCTAQTIAVTPSPLPTNTLLPPTAIPTSTIPPSPTTIPRPSLSADEVKTIAAEFERITNEHLQSWANRDYDQMRQVYTEDIVHHDLNYEPFKGINSVISVAKMFLGVFPNYENRLVSTFVGHDDGFYFEDSWGWVPDDYVKNIFSSDHPLKNYMWMTLRDEKFSYWWLFYDEEVFSAGNLPFNRKLLQDYVDAWSSGDPEAVASLYTSEAIRQDTLFSENQQGISAIKAFATHFFAWYPGVRLTLLETFGEFPHVDKRGGVYSVSVSNPSDQPCDVSILVLIQPDESEQKIAQEWVFYNSDSLIACGWAQ